MIAASRAPSFSPFSKAVPIPSNMSVPASGPSLSVVMHPGVAAPSLHHDPSSLFASRRCDMMTIALWYRVRHPVLAFLFPHSRDPLSRIQRLKILLFVAVVQFDLTYAMFTLGSQISVGHFRSVFAMMLSVILGYPFLSATYQLWPFDPKVCLGCFLLFLASLPPIHMLLFFFLSFTRTRIVFIAALVLSF